MEDHEVMTNVDDLPKEGETKRETFVRLTNYRLRKTIKRIRQIGNLSNKSNYDYTEADIDFIRTALLLEVEQMLGRFNPQAVDESFPELEG